MGKNPNQAMFFPFIPIISGQVEAVHEWHHYWLKALLGLWFMHWNSCVHSIKATRNTASTADNLSRKAGQFMKEKHSHPCKGGQDLGEGASTRQVCE